MAERRLSKGKMTGFTPGGSRRRRKTPKKCASSETRMMDTRVKSARGRKLSSTLWLKRQLNDPYVKKAREMGYRSRAAFKLKELDDKFGLLSMEQLIVDLGAAPGGWSQVALEKGADRVIGIDLLDVDPVTGAEFIKLDVMNEAAPGVLMELLGGKADLVMSDLAANTTGHKKTDHWRTVALVEAAADFSLKVLKPGGSFVTKVFQGGAEKTLLDRLKVNFELVKHAKPKASRPESPELYLVAKGYRHSR